MRNASVRAGRRSGSRAAGIVLMLVALVAAVLTSLPVAAEETSGEAEIEETALIVSPANDAIPDTALEQFPPQVVCVLFPELCTEDSEDVRGLVGDLLGTVNENERTAPLQPVPPDTLTVSYLAGSPRYQSAFRLATASLPIGDVSSFSITFPQGQPSYSMASPLFRGAVLDAVNFAGARDPEAFLTSLAGRLETLPPLEQPILGIEACPLTLPLPADSAAPQSSPSLAIEEPDGEGGRQAAVDCLFGANGVFDGDAQTWTFDLTFAAQAWATGSLPNHGVLLRPTGAENLAFGDPDVTTNAQVVLDVSTPPTVTTVTPDPVEPPPTSPPPPATAPETTAPPPSSSSAPPPPSSTLFTSPPSVSPGSTTAPPPQTASPEVAEPTTADPVAIDALPASEPASTPWVWLILLVFAVGAWLTARSLTAELVVGSAEGRHGALARLTTRF